MTHLVMAIAALGAAVVIPSPPAAAAAEDGQVGIRLLEAPVARRDDPRAHMYIVDHLAPGMRISRLFEVINKTDERREFDIYAGSASLENDEFVYGKDRETNELSSWVTLSKNKDTLDPGETVQVEATIVVPKQASRGERYAVIWAETRAAPDKKGNIGAIRRVGIRVYLSVGPGGEPISSFDIGQVTVSRGDDGVPRISTLVHNTGERALDINGTLNLSDGPGSMRAGPYQLTTVTTLAPGASGIVVAALDAKLPDGAWRLDLDLASGTVKRHLDLAITLQPPGLSMVATVMENWWGWFGAGGAALVVIALAALLLVRRRRRQPAAAVAYRPRHL
ncbi:hypothetical protein SAMN05421812_103279 [Asanoa hainanensis]|uniref:DUF916 domain-containing protein n=1 Tax=Asanoa hainanensis TaxID=560556 RepID=A0A239K2I5_9ACTN|nr:hypothetical protein [Asanoa hainanensis]SNT12597.1 hypothetical protein SAMN05421812_103279 [Asanoa hainanensis]